MIKFYVCGVCNRHFSIVTTHEEGRSCPHCGDRDIHLVRVTSDKEKPGPRRKDVQSRVFIDMEGIET